MAELPILPSPTRDAIFAAYEAQSNRLRALGHMQLAVRLAGSSTEGPTSQLALAQLLARLGHAPEACQAALRVLRRGLDRGLGDAPGGRHQPAR